MTLQARLALTASGVRQSSGCHGAGRNAHTVSCGKAEACAF
jgi:hypothetical protein